MPAMPLYEMAGRYAESRRAQGSVVVGQAVIHCQGQGPRNILAPPRWLSVALRHNGQSNSSRCPAGNEGGFC